MKINNKYISSEAFQNFSSARFSLDYCKHTDKKFSKASVLIYLLLMSI